MRTRCADKPLAAIASALNIACGGSGRCGGAGGSGVVWMIGGMVMAQSASRAHLSLMLVRSCAYVFSSSFAVASKRTCSSASDVISASRSTCPPSTGLPVDGSIGSANPFWPLHRRLRDAARDGARPLRAQIERVLQVVRVGGAAEDAEEHVDRRGEGRAAGTATVRRWERTSLRFGHLQRQAADQPEQMKKGADRGSIDAFKSLIYTEL